MEPSFKLEFEAATGQIMFDATYPAGCHHRTSMDKATLIELFTNAHVVYEKSVA